MKKPHVFLIAAITVDGFLAHTSDEPATWSSSEDKKFFRSKTEKAGVMVMGSNTYKTFSKPLPNRKHIVLTHDPGQFDNHPDVEFMNGSVVEVIDRLSQSGFDEIAICGGAHVYQQFIEADLVDELFITIEPRLFGDGVSLLSSAVDISLKLDSTQSLNDDSLLLTYKRKAI